MRLMTPSGLAFQMVVVQVPSCLKVHLLRLMAVDGALYTPPLGAGGWTALVVSEYRASPTLPTGVAEPSPPKSRDQRSPASRSA